MMMEISVAVIAAAFVALVIYLLVVMKSLRITLRRVNQILEEGHEQLKGVRADLKNILEHTNEVSVDLRNKMRSLDSLFKTVGNVSDLMEYKTACLKKDFMTSYREEQPAKERQFKQVADILEFAGLGIRLWEKLRKERR